MIHLHVFEQRPTSDQSALLDALVNVGLDELAQLAELHQPPLRIRQLAEALATLSPRAVAPEEFDQRRSLTAFRRYERAWADSPVAPHAYATHFEFIFSGSKQ